MSNLLPSVGVDIGTSYIIAARQQEGDKILFSTFRDAFFRLKPTTIIAKNMIEKGLKGQHYFLEEDGSFIILGQDAIERAVERNQSAERPLEKGVISPRQKKARHILRHIFKEILGPPLIDGERLIYSVPAQPIDQPADRFDVGYHIDALNNDLRSLGYNPSPLNEAEAICYSELEDDGYTGLVIGFGAGMSNACLMSSGEGIIHYSLCQSGDFVDRMAAQATASEDTVVQVEKEHGTFVIGQEVPNNSILSAVSLYYTRLIDYTVQHMIIHLSLAQNLPKFSKPIPIVISGGTSKASGFIEEFKRLLAIHEETTPLPFEVKEVRAAKDPLRATARGLLLACSI